MISLGTDWEREMRRILLAAFVLVLAGCGGRDEPESLINVQNQGDGPDEFVLIPNEPLEIPEDIASRELPEPGGENRTEQTPDAILASALGGRATAGVTDSAFVRATQRFGVTEDIREVLADEDEEIRRTAFIRVLERAARVNVYFRVYEDQTLDSYEELDRLRQTGVKTPVAPPQSE